MIDKESATRNALAASRRLAEADPQDEAVGRVVAELSEQVGLLNELARADKSSPWGSGSMKDDVDFIGDQIKKLKSAAAIPAANYRRMYDILSKLEKVWVAASPRMQPAFISCSMPATRSSSPRAATRISASIATGSVRCS